MSRKPSSKPANVIAIADLRTLRVDLQRGTFQEAWACYQASMALEALKPASRRVYTQAALLAIATLPASPRAGDVTLWLEALKQGGRAPATVNKLLRALKAITERATLVQRGGGNLLLRNAFKQQRPFRLAARTRRDASAATVQRLLQLAATPFERLAVRLAAFYGLRKGELLGLMPGDARNDYGKLRVTVERTRGKFGVNMRKNALNGKAHVLVIDDGETAGILSALLRDEVRLSLATKAQRELARDYVLPWGCDHMDTLMRAWRRDPGVHLPKGDGFHALRHYGATALAANGATMTEIQGWLGDSTPTAAQTYMGQVRGTTCGTASRIVASFEQEKGDGGESDGARAASKTTRAPGRNHSHVSCDADQLGESREEPRCGFNPTVGVPKNPTLGRGENHE